MGIVIFIIIVILIYLAYMLYFKEYVDVCKIFRTLEKTLDTRDLLVMQSIAEIKNKKIKGETTKYIDKRMKIKKSGFNEKIRADVDLNKKLKETYKELNNYMQNPVIRSTFLRIVVLEKKLKVIREEYNIAVEKYNLNMIHHKAICMGIIRMKPLDTYKSSAEN